MKIGDYILKFDERLLKGNLKNISKEDMPIVKAKSLAMSAIVDIALEIFDSPSMGEIEINKEEMGYFCAETIAGAAACCVFRLGKRTDNPELFEQYFKNSFQAVLNNLKGQLE